MEDMEVVDENGECLALPKKFYKIPITALRISVRRVIALYLNDLSDVVDDETGHVNDYNGLAELVGFEYLEIKHFARQKSPTEELFERWEDMTHLEPCIGKLWEYLKEMGRFDIMKDCRLGVEKDVEAYIRNRQRFEDIKPLQSNDVSQSDEAPDHNVHEDLIICRGDVEKNSPQYFDAYVSCASEKEDVEFVMKMINELEKVHGLSLYVPMRDELAGGAKYVMDAKLIESRCKRMLIILTRSYMKSSACEFQVKFAHALSPGARSKRLIPVLIEPQIHIPQILRHVTLCDYTKVDLRTWFWDRLATAIKQPLDPKTSGFGTGTQSSNACPAHWNKDQQSSSQTSHSPSSSNSSSMTHSASSPAVPHPISPNHSYLSAVSSEGPDSGIESSMSSVNSLDDNNLNTPGSSRRKTQQGKKQTETFFKKFKNKMSRNSGNNSSDA